MEAEDGEEDCSLRTLEASLHELLPVQLDTHTATTTWEFVMSCLEKELHLRPRFSEFLPSFLSREGFLCIFPIFFPPPFHACMRIHPLHRTSPFPVETATSSLNSVTDGHIWFPVENEAPIHLPSHFICHHCSA